MSIPPCNNIHHDDSIDDDDGDSMNNALGPVPQLFRAFTQVHYPNNPSILTISRLREYLLQMCNDPRRRQRLQLQQHQDLQEEEPPP